METKFLTSAIDELSEEETFEREDDNGDVEVDVDVDVDIVNGIEVTAAVLSTAEFELSALSTVSTLSSGSKDESAAAIISDVFIGRLNITSKRNFS
jgi:hypothetical protein